MICYGRTRSAHLAWQARAGRWRQWWGLVGPAEAVVERVAGAADGADRVRLLAAIDGLAQPADMDVDGALVDIDVRAPDAIEQLLPREHTARPFHQELQQPVFGRTQIDRAARAGDALLLAVELDVADRQDAGDPLRIGAAQERAHARQEFRHRERLDDVIVGAGGEAAHLLAFLAAGGEHDDRQRAGFRPRPQTPAQLDAGQAGQHPVEHDEVGRLFLEPGVRLVAAGGGVDVVTLRLEIIAKQHGERLFVFDDQNAGAHRARLSLDF